MRSFADEKKQGTLELLLTKPISLWEIVLGKFSGCFILILLALLPSLIYVEVIWSLGAPKGNLDLGSCIGSYFGLLFLIAAYSAIGLFTSTLSENQIVAFITAVFLCFLIYFGFEGLASLSKDFSAFISYFGMQDHYKSMSRGVLDTRDIIYFVSVSSLFLSFTVYNLKAIKS